MLISLYCNVIRAYDWICVELDATLVNCDLSLEDVEVFPILASFELSLGGRVIHEIIYWSSMR